ncbi:MAG: heavy-metal-associated domain-containing protein [Planctomycetota bacterium]|nr:heavy-metal-associated domain-containing protein [Planctomycetota bacterium]MDA1178683.1 heavy-metal-associated domain-containing protein [Planctomycetota bacterium]
MFRTLILGITSAALAIFFVGCGSSSSTPNGAQSSPGETRQVVLRVPTMHCPHGCFPSVKETLAAMDGVQSVSLVPQAEEGKIDDPRVAVTYSGEFNREGAVQALATASFPDATIDTN